ncbi:hypothetical protein HBB16_19355 [Pseudonocardia sp. MCCB 268]|nr:hypothetical protein [Pseudonocardia cytotoxica]
MRTLGRPGSAGAGGSWWPAPTARASTARILAGAGGQWTAGRLYTSPHSHRPQERITIDGVTTTDDELAAVPTRWQADERTASELRPSWFELMTAGRGGLVQADQRKLMSRWSRPVWVVAATRPPRSAPAWWWSRRWASTTSSTSATRGGTRRG